MNSLLATSASVDTDNQPRLLLKIVFRVLESPVFQIFSYQLYPTTSSSVNFLDLVPEAGFELARLEDYSFRRNYHFGPCPQDPNSEV